MDVHYTATFPEEIFQDIVIFRNSLFFRKVRRYTDNF
jgi:hypothetical protein